MRLIQLLDPSLKRRVAIVEGNELRLINGHLSVYGMAMVALDEEMSLEEVASKSLSSENLEYGAVYHDLNDWSILPALDHPDDAAHCMVSGTGLTHLAGAKHRDSMHADAPAAVPVTDSMRMYEWGVAGGRPAAGEIGVQPEWFYKGLGGVLRGHSDNLVLPSYANDGGEEPEIVGAYIIDWSGTPRRVGMAIGNEFSDHQMERKNYLYLAPSKLRNCSIGPELVTNPRFEDVRGRVQIERAGEVIWSKDLVTGEANMCHSLVNMEHHHFKYAAHRRPGDVHVHFFGAGAFSFGDGVALQNADVMQVSFDGFGRPLRNPLRIDRSEQALVEVKLL
jgi:hypothetical protein